MIRTALRLVDTHGRSGMTMRALAAEMGVGVMTLYGYVSGKDEILDAVALEAAKDIHLEPVVDEGWEDQVRAAVRLLYLACLDHPKLIVIVLQQASPSPGLYRTRERILAALHEAGFADRAALRALGILSSYVIGFAAARNAAHFDGLADRLRELPALDFPNLTRAADYYHEHISDETFDYGLTQLLDSLRRELN